MSRRWTAVLMLTGLVLVHVAWVLAVPPFRGIDEFDHVYRAASVAQGQVRAENRVVADGRGDYVHVPREVVEDAGPVCDTYKYVGRDNCYAAGEVGEDRVVVASAAARYHPIYYGLVGIAANSRSGAEFVYAARLATVATCVALWGLACMAALRSRTPRVAFLALGISATPVLIYSGSMVAPNGVEIAAAVASWMAFLAMDRRQSLASERLLLLIAAFAATILVTVRTLGPVWLALLVLTVLCLPGRRSRIGLLMRHPGLAAFSVVTVGVSTALSVWWVLSERTNSLGQDPGARMAEPWLNSLLHVPLWVFQSIAAFPIRNQPAPEVVYAAVLAAIAVALLTTPAVRLARWWVCLAAMTLVWLVPPFVFTLLTFAEAGALWQGRYSLPYSVGILLVLLTWAGTRQTDRTSRVLVSLIGGAYAVAHAVSIVNVRRDEMVTSPLSGDPRWITAPEPVLIAMAVVGTALIFLAPALAMRRGNEPNVCAPSSRERVPAQ